MIFLSNNDNVCNLLPHLQTFSLWRICILIYNICRMQILINFVATALFNYKRVLAMDNLRPITEEQMRLMIASDTTHYKVVITAQ